MPFRAAAQILTLPSGRLTVGEIRQPEDIVTWVIVNPDPIETRKTEQYR